MKICWIDNLRHIPAAKHPVVTAIVKRPVVTAILIGVLIHLISAVPLLISGQGKLALNLPVFLGTIGIVWSLASYWLGSHKYRVHLKSFETALNQQSINKYRELVKDHLKALNNNWKYFPVSILLWLLVVAVFTADFYGRLPEGLSKSLKVFPPEWYSPELRPYRLATIYVFAIPVVFLVWTLGRLMILHTLFLVRINHLRWVRSQHICFLRFHPLLRINVFGAITWSVGVALFGLLLRSGYTPGRLAFLGLLGSVATIAFFWPTFLFQKKLKQIGRGRVDTLVDATRDELEKRAEDPTRWTDLYLLEEQLKKVETDFSGAVAWRYVGSLTTTFILPVLVSVLATVVTKYF